MIFTYGLFQVDRELKDTYEITNVIYIFEPFYFQPFVYLKCVSYKQHVDRSCFFIHSDSLCLLIGGPNPVTFRVIIERDEFSASV